MGGVRPQPPIARLRWLHAAKRLKTSFVFFFYFLFFAHKHFPSPSDAARRTGRREGATPQKARSFEERD